MNLSKKALELLKVLFAENSNLQLPVAMAEMVVEIRKWIEKELVEEELKGLDKDN